MAFFVRFDGALVLAPVLILQALEFPRSTRSWPERLTRLTRSVGPLVLAVVVWSVYCRVDHGTFVFWGHSVQVNMDTGLGAESQTSSQWWVAGMKVVGTMAVSVLPSRIGWGPWLGLLLALAAAPWTRPGAARSWALCGLCLLGVWLGMGMVAQHDPVHNLYWKWLCPVIPVIVPLGVSALDRVAERLVPIMGRAAAWCLLLLAVAQATAASLWETRRQVELSNLLYRPQLDLALWIEEEVPEDVPMVLDNIPACWLDRRAHERELVSWFDVPTNSGDEVAFASWLTDQRVGWVLWFREEWTQAPRVAPFLSTGGRWEGGGISLEEVGREDSYGWIFYRVTRFGSDKGG
jgi:hypothetical protein